MLDREQRVRDQAMFDLAIDSKLQGCDLLRIKIGELVSRVCVRPRAIVIQRKTRRPIQHPPVCSLVDEWVSGIGLHAQEHGTHSLRRTKASIIYKRTGNLRAVQNLLGHTKIDSTVRYLGVDIDDALALADGTEL